MVVKEFSATLSGVRYAQRFGDDDDLARDMKGLCHDRIGDILLIALLREAVSQPQFEEWYRKYEIDSYGEFDTWKEFKYFFLSL